MGQYHKLYNVTKQEFVHPHKINNGLKLLEQIGDVHSTATALFLLVTNSNNRGGGDAQPHSAIGRWAGDKIVVQGDYAEPGDNGYVPFEELENYTDISDIVVDMFAVGLANY